MDPVNCPLLAEWIILLMLLCRGNDCKNLFVAHLLVATPHFHLVLYFLVAFKNAFCGIVQHQQAGSFSFQQRIICNRFMESFGTKQVGLQRVIGDPLLLYCSLSSVTHNLKNRKLTI
jgi:hypothetical protein